ncbi:Dinucleoside triphosphate hydrolase [Conoideocrella luteorostrata]|uniref:Bis(5'-adenosyl)-triphosphatase n=1 Tax=Conoideocrella luteorostrata TaxID=1105319 RepID=A0AAJ0G0J4_9HYPO|nr:Dinucleoside triphosphate hydrolase [Conoideocrella luteorostrata]
MASTKTKDMSIKFGPFEVTKQVFLTTPHSYALVNLKPLVPGHILVCPLKQYLRLTDLSPAETADLFSAVQLAQRMLAKRYFPDPEDVLSGSFTVAVQDGPASGQTVPHVHVHVIPRKAGDVGEVPDAIYDKMASESGNVGGALWDRDRGRRPAPGGGMPKIEDEDRKARTQEEMEEEAGQYKKMLVGMGVD